MVVISRNLPQKRLVRKLNFTVFWKWLKSHITQTDDLMWFLKVSSSQIKQIGIEPIEIDAFIQASQFTKE